MSAGLDTYGIQFAVVRVEARRRSGRQRVSNPAQQVTEQRKDKAYRQAIRLDGPLWSPLGGCAKLGVDVDD